MIATSVRSPITGIDYLWPRAKQKVSVTDQRRTSLQHVPGADGAQDHYGLNAFPRAEAMVTISFRVTPKASGTNFDALRSKLNLAVDHGLPQRLTFTDDRNVPWFATGKLTGKNLDADENQQWSADWSLTYVIEDPLAFGALAGSNTWGEQGLKWGAAGLKWGANPTKIALNTTTVGYLLQNPDATAETRDMVFSFDGRWGPASIAAGANFSVANSDIIDLGTGAPVTFAIYDTLPLGTNYQVDCGSVGVYRNGAPVIGTLWKPTLQFGYMRFRPGDNHLVFTVNGTPAATPNGDAIISWRPKKSLA